MRATPPSPCGAHSSASPHPSTGTPATTAGCRSRARAMARPCRCSCLPAGSFPRWKGPTAQERAGERRRACGRWPRAPSSYSNNSLFFRGGFQGDTYGYYAFVVHAKGNSSTQPQPTARVRHMSLKLFCRGRQLVDDVDVLRAGLLALAAPDAVGCPHAVARGKAVVALAPVHAI